MSFGPKSKMPPFRPRQQARRQEEPVGTTDISKRLAAWLISGGTLRTGPLGLQHPALTGRAQLYGG